MSFKKLVVLSLVLALPLSAVAQDCIDYRDYLRWVGGVATPGGAYGVDVAGTHAYVGSGNPDGLGGGLQVVDITNPASPQIVGSVATPGGVYGVAVAGTHAYAAAGTDLLVVDITNPASPQIVGSVATPDYAQWWP